jgi:hypothetical protein
MQIPGKWFLMVLGFVLLAPTCFSQGSKGGGSSSQSGGQQSSSQSAGSNSPGGGQSGNQGGGTGGGFSIEAEILAYKSLQSDSEAIACDIAGFLFEPETTGFSPNGASPPTFTSACASSSSPGRIGGGTVTKGKVADATVQDGKQDGATLSGATLTGATIKEATITGASPATPLPKGVIILSSSGTTMSNFQVWRMDMAIMTQLEMRAADFKCPSKAAEETMSVAGLDVAQQAVTLVQGVIGLFASNESAAGVTGTIQDQALVDSVGRQLRNLNVSVLMPDTYGPFTFTGIDYQSSPFFQNFALLFRCRICLQAFLKDPANQVSQEDLDADKTALKANLEKQQADQKLSGKELEAKLSEIADLKAKAEELKESIKEKTQKQGRMNDAAGLLASIDAFISSLAGTGASPSGSDATKSQSQTQSQTQTKADTGTPSAPSSPSNSSPPIAAVLAADGLARELGMKADGSLGEGSIWKHVLLLKALESGGSLITHSNIWGSKVFFSGGAVATYALFTLNGRLSCSGNVFDYGGYIRAQDFNKSFREPNIDPKNHLIFVRGGCASPDEVSSNATQK